MGPLSHRAWHPAGAALEFRGGPPVLPKSSAANHRSRSLLGSAAFVEKREPEDQITNGWTAPRCDHPGHEETRSRRRRHARGRPPQRGASPPLWQANVPIVRMRAGSTPRRRGDGPSRPPFEQRNGRPGPGGSEGRTAGKGLAPSVDPCSHMVPSRVANNRGSRV